MTDLKEKEYQLLSEKTGIPLKEIPNAFNSFSKLFPPKDKNTWFYKFPKSSIEWHNFFPISFSGIGANYRRLVYTNDGDYDILYKMLSSEMTAKDLSKWNNLAYNILK